MPILGVLFIIILLLYSIGSMVRSDEYENPLIDNSKPITNKEFDSKTTPFKDKHGVENPFTEERGGDNPTYNPHWDIF